MRFAGFVLLAVSVWWPAFGIAQDAVQTEKIADTMVRLCVGGGRTEATSGTGTGGVDLSLRVVERYFGRAVAAQTAAYMQTEASSHWLCHKGAPDTAPDLLRETV